jgi:hypothetical protein
VLVMLKVKTSLAPKLDDALKYVRSGLHKFVRVAASESAAHLPISCYVTNVDPHGEGNCISIPALQEYNKAAHRHMGLLVVTDALLASCALNLHAALHAEEHAAKV